MAKLSRADLENILLPSSAQMQRLSTSCLLRNARPKPEILLVDSSAPRRKLLQDMLGGLFAASSCKFYNASSLKEAWSLYLSYGPDMVFIDAALADFCGYRFTRIIRLVDPQAFVVMVADVATPEDEQEVRTSGARGLLVKPYDMQRMESVCKPISDIYNARKKAKK